MRQSLKVLKCSTVSSTDVASIIINSEPKCLLVFSGLLFSYWVGLERASQPLVWCLGVNGFWGEFRPGVPTWASSCTFCVQYVLRILDTLYLASGSHCRFLKVLTSSPDTCNLLVPRGGSDTFACHIISNWPPYSPADAEILCISGSHYCTFLSPPTGSCPELVSLPSILKSLKDYKHLGCLGGLVG